MHVSPAKQLSMTTKKEDGQTDGQTDAGQSDPYVPLCFKGVTKISYSRLCGAVEMAEVILRS